MANIELKNLAEIIAAWADPPPGVVNVYLFGSRVRGDHKCDSDVDIRVYPEDWLYDPTQATIRWWQQQNETNFADLQKRLPGPLHLGRYKMDHGHRVDQLIMQARAAPVLVCRKVSCLWIPPTPK